jgi:hypothetical protein
VAGDHKVSLKKYANWVVNGCARCNQPACHIVVGTVCARFVEIQARGGGMQKNLMLVNTTNYFRSFIPPAQFDCLQNDQIVPPLCSLPVALPVQSLPRHARLPLVDCCVCFIGRRPSKATMYYIFDFCCCSIRCPEQRDNTPPHVPPRSHLLSNIPQTANANYRLVVVSPHPVAAI